MSLSQDLNAITMALAMFSSNTSSHRPHLLIAPSNSTQTPRTPTCHSMKYCVTDSSSPQPSTPMTLSPITPIMIPCDSGKQQMTSLVYGCSANTVNSEDSIIRDNGLRIESKMHDGVQGQLFVASNLNSSKKANHSDKGKPGEASAIKRVSIELHLQGVTELDGMLWCIPKDVIKEGLILHYLTVQNRCLGDYVVHKRRFFSSTDHYYLVTQHAQGVSLDRFTETAHQYIRMGLLKRKEYVKIVRFIFWQLFVFLHWLHHDMSVCHLDLKPKHVILQDAEFDVDPCTGQLLAPPSIVIKVIDFGSAELFANKKFACWKECSPLAESRYQCPKSYKEVKYDARLHDMWAVGVMLAECLMGRPLFETRRDEGYVAVRHDMLDEYFELLGLCKYFNVKAVDCLKKLLSASEAKRLRASDALQHKWFKSYYAKYKKAIGSKSQTQKRQLSKQMEWISQMPFYAAPVNV